MMCQRDIYILGEPYPMCNRHRHLWSWSTVANLFLWKSNSNSHLICIWHLKVNIDFWSIHFDESSWTSVNLFFASFLFSPIFLNHHRRQTVPPCIRTCSIRQTNGPLMQQCQCVDANADWPTSMYSHRCTKPSNMKNLLSRDVVNVISHDQPV